MPARGRILCSLFLRSTIIHEATHFRDTLRTVDHGYDVDYCKQFAREDPDKAVENAEYVVTPLTFHAVRPLVFIDNS